MDGVRGQLKSPIRPSHRHPPDQVGVADLLDGARWLGRYPERVVLLGLVPESMGLAVGLTPRVLSALPALVERVVAEASALGFAFHARPDGDLPAPRRGLDVARLAAMR